MLYSAHLRRLGGVTQVTSPSELHTFHNRLTHTLEVAQIARRIAERLLTEDSSRRAILDPDVCETAALIHDLGHPPFGHNGELTSDKLARESDHHSDGNEGNAQSFRIVNKLAVRKANEVGLNLTAASLRASLKYPVTRKKDQSGKYEEISKFGVYVSEQPEFDKVFEGRVAGNPVLEAEIMDWADDIAYSAHDLYDFVLAGLIPLHSLVELDGPGLRELLSDRLKDVEISDDAFASVALSTKTLPQPNLGRASRFSSGIVADLKAWVSERISRYATLEALLNGGRLTIDPEIRGEVEILKALTYHFAIGSPALSLRQRGEKAILKGLFDVLSEDAKGPQTLLSDEARGRLTSDGQTRVVLDAISSMTDTQAVSMYHKTHGIKLASILDITTTSML